VTLPKPLGAVLEEAQPTGVRVEELQEGGSALETGLLKKGDRLRSIQGTDVSSSSFDAVMEMLVDAPSEVELTVSRVAILRKPAGAAAAKLAAPVLTIGGEEGDAQKGVILRTAIQGRGVELYKGMMAKMSNCGGAGQCSTCWVRVLEGEDNLSPMTPVEAKKAAKKPSDYRMACQAIIEGDVSVEIP